MLVSLGMDVPSMVEDILSDEYEEGEILDNDILYENVSSLEEFSDVDDKKSVQKGVRADSKKIKSKRKKEHKCKMDSLCRVERSGKHCYARIRKRRSSLELKSSRNTSCAVLGSDLDRKQRPQSAKSISPNRGFNRDTFSKESAKSKGKSDVRKRGLPYYFQHDNRLHPPKKVVPDRRCKQNRRLSVEDHRSSNRKRKSRSPSPKRPAIEAGRTVTKSSLLDRLVGSGSIPLKANAETDAKPADHEDQDDSEPGASMTVPNLCTNCDVKDITHELCPADIPVPPTPKAQSPEPPKQEIEELHLRLHALKTAIIKKHTDLKRKKRIASSKKRDSVEDSFTEFAMKDLLEDECDSIPTPPPPGTDWPLAPLDDNRWSDEDMVIDQESVCGDVMIESNIPASDPSLQSVDYTVVSSPSSHDKLPCCRGNPIPVVTHHRPSREAEPVKKPPSSVIPLVFDSEEPASGSALPPKYLKEINSNKLMRKRRRSQGIHVRGKGSLGWHPRKRRNSIRQGPKQSKSVQPKERPKGLKDDDDEDELRKLALMSVKPKSTITGGMLTSVGTDLNPLSIDTDPPTTTDKVESPTKQSPAEPWDDLDEDILRAQLLSSLSRNIPNAQPDVPKQDSPIEVKKQIFTKKINKENLYARRNAAPHLAVAKPQKKIPAKFINPQNPAKFINPKTKSNLTPPLNPPSKVEKFIIKVSDSETSEDEELKGAKSQVLSGSSSSGRKSDIEMSIDRLLEQARKETELIQKASQFYPVFSVPESDGKTMPAESVIEDQTESLPAEEPPLLSPNEKLDENLPSSSISHSEGVSHLPVWQQEEIQRQKRVMAHKGSIIEAAKRKIREKAEPKKPSGEVDDSPMTVEKPAESAVPEPVAKLVDGPETSPIIDSLPSVTTKDCAEPNVTESLPDDTDNSEVEKIVEELLTRVCGNTEQITADCGSAALPPVTSIDGGESKKLLKDANVAGNQRKTVPELKSKRANQSPSVANSPKPKVSSANAPLLKTQLRNSSVNSTVIPVKGILLRAAPKTVLQNPAMPKNASLPNAVANSSISMIRNPNGIAQKNPFVFKDSSYAAKALNEMVGMVTTFESGMSEYKNLKKDYIALRKQLVLAHQRMSKKRQGLLEMKTTIENKRRLLDSTMTMDTSALSPLPDNREQPKQSSRDSELFALRYKEVCLRAQFAMMGLQTPSKPAAKPVAPTVVKNSRPLENPVVSPKKRPKLRPRPVEKLRPLIEKQPVRPSQPVLTSSNPVVPKPLADLPSSSKKLVVSVHDKDMDPLIPLCPYDLTGVCKDEECKYQHLRTE